MNTIKALFGKKIIGNVFWMIFDKVFLLALNLLVTLKIANHYGSEVYGNYQYLVSVVAIFEALVRLTDGRIVKKYFSEYSVAQVVWNASIARMIVTSVSFLAGIVIGFFLGFDNQSRLIFMVLLLNILVYNLRFGMLCRYEYMLQAKRIVVASDCSLLLGYLVQICFVNYGFGIVYIAISMLFSSIINVILLYWQYRKEYGYIYDNLDINMIKSIFKESFPIALAVICTTIYAKCDSVMIGSFLSKADVGIYSIAIKMASVIHIMVFPIQESVYPQLVELYKTNYEKYRDMYIKYSSVLSWFSLMAILLSIFVIPFFMGVLNAEYRGAYSTYVIYVIGIWFTYNAALRAGHCALIGRGDIILYGEIISVILNVILNYFLIFSLGRNGAAIATSVTYAVSLMISNLFFGQSGKEIFEMQIVALNPKVLFAKKHEITK